MGNVPGIDVSKLSAKEVYARAERLPEDQARELLDAWWSYQNALPDLEQQIREEIREAPYTGTAVKGLCERAGMTQIALARTIGMERGNLNACLSRPQERTFSKDQLVAVLDALQVSGNIRALLLEKLEREKKLLSLRAGDLSYRLHARMPLCRMIRFLRMRKLWTQEEAAAACGFSFDAYRYMEEEMATREKPCVWEKTSWERIEKVCTALDASPGQMRIMKTRYIAERRPSLESEVSKERTGLGKILTDIRIAAGQSQDEAAVALGVHQAGLSLWELNKKKPTFPVLLRYAEVYGLDDRKKEEIRKLWRDEKSPDAGSLTP